MNIRGLISSTNSIKKGKREESQVFTKKFGAVFLFNKKATLSRIKGIISISMFIRAATEKFGIGERRKDLAYHKVTLAFKLKKDIDYRYYSPEELVSLVRKTFKEYEDEEKWPIPDVLAQVLDKPNDFFKEAKGDSEDSEFLRNAVVFRATNAENKTNDGSDSFEYAWKDVDTDRYGENGYCLVSKDIPEDAEVQVWCSCSDYYWTFQFYNCENNVDLFGKYPERYIPKTKRGYEAFKKGQPIRNPGRRPGMCKHLMLLLALLMKDNVIKNENGELTKHLKANYSNFNMKKTRLSQNEYDNMIRTFYNNQNIKNQQRKLAHDTSYGAGGHNVGWGAFNYKTGKFGGH